MLWLHGVPDSSELWTPFLERAGGVAPDLLGFGAQRQARRPRLLDRRLRRLARALLRARRARARPARHARLGRRRAGARRSARPSGSSGSSRSTPCPFLPGYRWHPFARVWRTPLLGEAAMGMAVGPVCAAAAAAPAAPTPVLAHFDPGTQRAILRLYRASPPAVLAAAGATSARSTRRRSSLHGARDRYIPAALRRRARRRARRRPRRARRGRRATGPGSTGPS